MDTAEQVGKSGDDLGASGGRLMAMTEAELDKWLAANKKSWESQDPALFAGLSTEDYAYRDAPFMERVPGPEFAALSVHYEAPTRGADAVGPPQGAT
jgi:hypothetical protein